MFFFDKYECKFIQGRIIMAILTVNVGLDDVLVNPSIATSFVSPTLYLLVFPDFIFDAIAPHESVVNGGTYTSPVDTNVT